MTRLAVLEQLPPCATTGIGSLPMMPLDEALAWSMQQDVPWLPEVLRSPADFMVPSALRGFEASDGSEALGPMWEPFLQALVVRRPLVAKAQLAGPDALLRYGRLADGTTPGEMTNGPARIAQHLEGKARRMVRGLRAVGVAPIVFFDEPGVGRDPASLQVLAGLLKAVQDEGGFTGVHCCAQAPWDEVLRLELDVLSIDARRSLDAVLECAAAYAGFTARGGRLCLGVVPTDASRSYVLRELCESVEASLRAAGGDFAQAIRRAWVSPACGLGMQSVEAASARLAEVRDAQAMLRELAAE